MHIILEKAIKYLLKVKSAKLLDEFIDRIAELSPKYRLITNKPKSFYKGVYWYKSINKWRAIIMIKGKRYSIGYFDDDKDAYEAIRKYKQDNKLR